MNLGAEQALFDLQYPSQARSVPNFTHYLIVLDHLWYEEGKIVDSLAGICSSLRRKSKHVDGKWTAIAPDFARPSEDAPT